MKENSKQNKFKVVFKLDRVSFDTINKFMLLQEEDDMSNKFLALNNLIGDCLWDIEKSEYTNNKEDIEEFLKSLSIDDLQPLVNNIADQIKIINLFNNAIK